METIRVCFMSRASDNSTKCHQNVAIILAIKIEKDHALAVMFKCEKKGENSSKKQNLKRK